MEQPVQDQDINFSISIGGDDWAKMSLWMKTGRIITLVSFILASIGLLVITGAIVVNVLGRVLFSAPLLGMVEIAGMGGIFLIPYSVILAERNRSHITVTMIVSTLPNPLRSIIVIITIVLSIVAIVLVTWGGILQVWDALVRPEMVTTVLRVPKAPFISVMVIGFAVLCGYLLQHLWEVLIKAVKK